MLRPAIAKTNMHRVLPLGAVLGVATLALVGTGCSHHQTPSTGGDSVEQLLSKKGFSLHPGGQIGHYTVRHVTCGHPKKRAGHQFYLCLMKIHQQGLPGRLSRLADCVAIDKSTSDGYVTRTPSFSKGC